MTKKILFFLFLFLFVISSCTGKTTEKKIITINKAITQEPGDTFLIKEDATICTEEGKPIIRKFATTWCPHCRWVKESYVKVVNEYSTQGKITAHLWYMDTGDDGLTKKAEIIVPQKEKEIFNQFNPKNSIPTFIFGCKYYRVGNAFEQQNNHAAEEAEFRAIIDKLIEEVNNEI